MTFLYPKFILSYTYRYYLDIVLKFNILEMKWMGNTVTKQLATSLRLVLRLTTMMINLHMYLAINGNMANGAT